MAENYRFCQQASQQYEQWLEEADGDPRVVASVHVACEWRTPYHLAPGRETIIPNPKPTYGETVQDFVNGLETIDQLFPNQPTLLLECEGIASTELKRQNFMDNMNA